MKTPYLIMILAALTTAPLRAADTDIAATAINSLGIDLLKATGKPDENALLSPYSIQLCLAMAYAGADGKTREEMAKVLHFPKDDTELNKSFAALQKELNELEKNTAQYVAGLQYGGPTEPVTLAVANRLYGQAGYDFREPYLALLKENYGAPLEQVDFKNAADKARTLINAWVEEQTRKRIQDLIPEGGLEKTTRLVLVDAIYLKAAWEDEFGKYTTKPAAFHVNGGAAQDVPMMGNQYRYGYAKNEGYTAVTLPYIGSGLQFLVLLPDDANGLAALESKLSPALLAGCAKLKPAEVELWMPKFKMEPPAMELGEQLQAMGMKTAFDDPPGSANFDGIAPRRPDGDYLRISKVFHKTFLSLDEHGTEAAAATAVVMNAPGGAPHGPAKPEYEVHVDHPFLFAIQDCESGASLFIGRVTDPR